MTTRDELIVKFTADIADFNRRLGEVQTKVTTLSSNVDKQTNRISNSFKRVGGAVAAYFSTQAIAGFIGQVVNLADQLQRLSDRTGLSAESLQRLRTVGIEAGVELNTIANAVQRLQLNLGKSTEKTTNVLQALGLDAETLRRQSPEQQFLTIIQRLEQIEDRSLRVATGTQLFGRGYRELEQVVTQGSQNIAEAMDKTIVATDDQVSRLDELGDKWEVFNQNIKNATIPTLISLLDYLNKISDVLSGKDTDNFFVRNISNPIAEMYGGATGNQPTFNPLMSQAPQMSFPISTPAKIEKQINEKELEKANKGEDKSEKAIKKTTDALKERAEAIKLNTNSSYAYSQAVAELIELENKGYLTHQETMLALDDLNETSMELTRTIADDLTEAINRPIRSFSDFREIALDALQKIALQAVITGFNLDKMASGFGGTGGGGITSGLGSLLGSGVRSILGFANGGEPPLNKPSIVGERGPELFVPKVAGSVVPNHKLQGGGSTQYVINQSLNFSTGVVDTVRAEVTRMMPQIATATQQSIVEANRRGGAMSIVMNNRS